MRRARRPAGSLVPCPKCDTSVRGDAVRCPSCGTPLDITHFRPRTDLEGDPLVDPMLELFERRETVFFCPVCLNEFRSTSRACRRCGDEPLDRAERKDYEARLLRRPVRSVGELVAQGPPANPPDLVPVRRSPDLEDAQACLEELRFMGLEARAGSDSLDPFDAPGEVGIWVRRKDVEAAEYLLSGYRAEDPLTKPPSEELPAGDARLARARGYFDLGKYRQVEVLLGEATDDVRAQELLADSLLRAGRPKEAHRRALGAAEAFDGAPAARGRLLGRAGAFLALAPDGTPFGPGADLPGARRHLEDAVSLAPRALDAGKALVEVLEALGDQAALAAELRRLDDVCPNLFGRSGSFRDLRDATNRAKRRTDER